MTDQKKDIYWFWVAKHWWPMPETDDAIENLKETCAYRILPLEKGPKDKPSEEELIGKDDE